MSLPEESCLFFDLHYLEIRGRYMQKAQGFYELRRALFWKSLPLKSSQVL